MERKDYDNLAIAKTCIGYFTFKDFRDNQIRNLRENGNESSARFLEQQASTYALHSLYEQAEFRVNISSNSQEAKQSVLECQTESIEILKELGENSEDLKRNFDRLLE